MTAPIALSPLRSQEWGPVTSLGARDDREHLVGCLWKALIRFATEERKWCELAPVPAGNSRKSGTLCCEISLNLPRWEQETPIRHLLDELRPGDPGAASLTVQPVV